MTTILTDIFAVFSAIGDWIVEALPTFFSLFYVSEGANAGLTLMGVLAIVSLGISVVFLLIGIIRRFMSFRA